MLSGQFRKALRLFPAILITGPRQAGKTTFLLNELGEEADYVSFDDPLQRDFAVSDPKGFLTGFTKPHVIIDEIQYVPELFPYLKMRIDSDRNTEGRWVLTGSRQFQLMKNVSESLAGRIAILELLPFSLAERLADVAVVPDDKLSEIVWAGGYPEPSLYPEKRDLWVRSYIQTYVERDVRQMQNVKDLRVFESFIGLCAARHGQTFNSAEMAREIGVSLPTIKAWAGILEAAYLCVFLSPYFRNYGKRLVKSPKLYFLDSALVCALTRQPDGPSALSGSMGGALFEGLVIGEAFKAFAAKGKKPDAFYWRSNDGLEVDLIVQIGPKFYPVEIKLTATLTLKHLEPLNKFRSIAGGDETETGLLVCRTDTAVVMPSGNMAMPWHNFSNWLLERLNG